MIKSNFIFYKLPLGRSMARSLGLPTAFDNNLRYFWR